VQLRSPYLSSELFFLASVHLESLMSGTSPQTNKKSLEFRELILQLLRVLSLYAEERDVQNFVRRQKLLKTLMRVI
jgi:hypothetical protein